MTSPIFRIYIKEVREGFVEIAAPDEERARDSARKNGFQAAGKVHAEYTKKVRLTKAVQ